MLKLSEMPLKSMNYKANARKCANGKGGLSVTGSLAGLCSTSPIAIAAVAIGMGFWAAILSQWTQRICGSW